MVEDVTVVGSSDPKPREGTRTQERNDRWWRAWSSRQTQNPARGRELGQVTRTRVNVDRFGRQTQNPARGRELAISANGTYEKSPVMSSDPKPREGTRTCTPAEWFRTRSSGRQTQNPARGRELPRRHRRTSRRPLRVVRPKTPRGDENLVEAIGSRVMHLVVRPKTPRGDENYRRTVHTKVPKSLCRQTQNPARGRELVGCVDGDVDPVGVAESSDPKPREGTRT